MNEEIQNTENESKKIELTPKEEQQIETLRKHEELKKACGEELNALLQKYNAELRINLQVMIILK